MNVSLTPELEQLVAKKVESGMYPSANDVIREALRLLQERDEAREAKLVDLRRDIQVGLDQLAQGQATTYDDHTLSNLVWEVQSEGRKRLDHERDSGPA
jgi:antitoxin ParD1/3/4